MKYHVYYAGEKLVFDKDPFDDVVLWEPGTIKTRQSNGRFVTLVHGPGIPILIKEVEPSKRPARIL